MVLNGHVNTHQDMALFLLVTIARKMIYKLKCKFADYGTPIFNSIFMEFPHRILSEKTDATTDSSTSGSD
jgi:hypothetical protein